MKTDAVSLLIAAEYHGGTLNKHDGSLYILHPIRVAKHAAVLAVAHGQDPVVCESVGYLHDAVEDTTLSFEVLMGRLMEGDVDPMTAKLIVDGVDAMTKRSGEQLEDYYARVKRNPVARIVKISDMTDNFRRNHMVVKEESRVRMAGKYSLGMDILSF